MAVRADVELWEQCLGGLTLGHQLPSELSGSLSADSGHQLWRDIVMASRRGQLAGMLPLTVGLLLLSLREASLLEARGEKWARLPPAEASAAEIDQLVPDLRANCTDSIPFFADVLEFELALHR